jgi:hypothetical protein
MFKILKRIKEIFDIFTNINLLKKEKIKFIFYSENASYKKYAYLLVKMLSEKYQNQVYYVSSDKDDKILNLNVKNIFIGKGFLMSYFFLTIHAENLFLTITDLDNHSIKKTKNIKNYIYYFHAAVSTTKNYTATAFDNYDILLCNGDYQINEIRLRENINKLKNKKLIKSGYFYFDYLKEKINYKIIPDEILIAPSWNYNQKNFINENLELIIKEILQKGYKVRFRPHPENFVRSKNKIEYICNKFKDELFILDFSKENKESMEKAKCLITDNSGIAIEYILLFKKPVLYFDDVDKIHNKEFDKYKNLQTMDNIVKDKFGFSFKINEIKSLDLIIQKSISEFRNKDNEIKIFTNKNFYNFNETIKKFEDLTTKYFN